MKFNFYTKVFVLSFVFLSSFAVPNKDSAYACTIDSDTFRIDPVYINNDGVTVNSFNKPETNNGESPVIHYTYTGDCEIEEVIPYFDGDFGTNIYGSLLNDHSAHDGHFQFGGFIPDGSHSVISHWPNVRVRVGNSYYWFSAQFSYFYSQDPAPDPVNNASYISQSVPTTMNAGQSYSVSVTMKNNGTKDWTTAGNYNLGYDASVWGSARVSPGGTINPTVSHTFTWTVTAPSTPGTYNFTWRMVQDGVEWFGDQTPNVSINVVSPQCNSGPAGYTKCADENGTCSFSGNANVKYGCNASFVDRDATNSISCNNTTFTDPAPGVVKACFQKAISPATIRIHTRNYSQSLISTATYSINPGGTSASGGYTEVSVSPSSSGTSYNIHLNSSPSGYTYTHSASSDGVTTYNGSIDITMWPGQGKDVTFYFNTTPVYGCTDPSANNYNPNANVNQGCTYTITGCTDPSANNYNPNANTSDGSCTYTVTGCTDPSANNYNPNANVNQGCTYTAPTVSISASPSSINAGGSSTLSWSSSNASSCSASGGWSGAKGTSGSESVSPASTATYSITCTGSGGSVSSSATVTVVPNRTLTTSIASGSGVVSGTGISCPGDCSDSYSNGTWVTLIATPSSGYNFSSWSGACAGQGSTCSIQMTSDKTASVNFAVAFNYSLSNDGNERVQKGGVDQFGQVIITKTLVAGSTQGVTLSASGQPSGVSVSFSGQGTAPTSNATANIAVSPDAPAGTYTVTVTGSPLSKTTSFSLTIVDSPALIVSCSATPDSVKLGESVTLSATASGGSGTGFTYTWSGSGIPTDPAPTGNPVTVSYSTVGSKTAKATVRDSLQNQGVCSPGASINVDFDPEFEEF